MIVIEFLLELKELHVFVNKQGDRLKVKGNKQALTSELKQKLAENKQQIIDIYTELSIDSNSQLAPTTFSQLRLWFIDQLEGGSVHYNMPLAMHFRGRVDVNAIQKAHNTILKRHESLRTTFTRIGDDPYQVIRDHQDIEVPICDLSELPKQAQEKEVLRLCVEETHTSFQLDKDKMMRWKLIRLAEDEIVLIRTMHHIASDGWSSGVLSNEFSQLYKAYSDGKSDPLEPLVIQYADYAHWQRQWLKGEVLESQLAYWTNQLSGIPSVHNIPLDRPRPKNQTFVGNDHFSHIKKDVAEPFNKLCFDHGATLFMGIHAVLSLLLSRYSGENDIVIGTPIANREQPDVAPLVGFFLNTLVFRSDLSKPNNFNELLEQSKNTAWGAYAHQQVPFEQLVNELNLSPSLSYSPVFQVMMILQNNDTGEFEPQESTIDYLNFNFNFAKFELTLNISQSKGGIYLCWNYNTDLFDLSTIRRLAANFEVLLKSVIANSQQSLSTLPILNQNEYDFCTKMFNKDQTSYQKDECVHQLFEQLALLNPHAVAVVFECSQLSYGELNERSNQLAHYLIEQGVLPNTLVGVCLPRSIEMIVAILAILKVGGAYVPIDIDYPEIRIEHICRDANLQVILTFSHLDLTANHQSKHFYLDTLSRVVSGYSKDNPKCSELKLSSESLAYVIYTSGSTGLPKGVKVSHKNLHSYYQSTKSTYNVEANDRVLQFSSFSFDIFVEEMFISLLSGASLILRTEHILEGQKKFWHFIKSQAVTVLSLPTAFWHELCSQLDGTRLNSNPLRLVIVGGEAMSVGMLERWRQCANESVQLLNTYGPTETTIVATSFDLTEFQNESTSVPIGKPFPNVSCYVLNEQQQVCPIKVFGELYIGGDGVAGGYLNQPQLTEERFIQNPFSSNVNDRLYKTGDKVRFLPNGDLEFAGRIDKQVKLRGFRIELGEIEYHLSQCEGIKSCIVLAKEVELGHKLLVAYVVLQNVENLNENNLVSNLRHSLSQQLPEYMLPSSFVALKRWPLTPNGKIDENKLPGPDFILNQSEYLPPSNNTEQVLVAVWSKLLKLDVDKLSITSNFFALGGHSLLAVRLVSEIREQLKHEITVKSVFEYSTIKALALFIDSMRNRKDVLDKMSSETGDDVEEIEW